MVVPDAPRRAALLTLGCARNEVDSEELAGRLSGSGWELVDLDAEGAGTPDVIVVNTCGFVEQAKKDSIDTLLAASDVAKESGAKVVAVGCLAERYGAELAESLPEADAVLGFDAYPDLAERLGDVLGGHAPAPHVPVDRRTLLPISPAQRPAAAVDVAVPGHAWVPDLSRVRLSDGPYAPLKLASGCDRRCAFCAIPSFRGSFVSRPPHDVLAEAAWLTGRGCARWCWSARTPRPTARTCPAAPARWSTCCRRWRRCRASTACACPTCSPPRSGRTCCEVIATTPGVAPYFDLSFQHASPAVLRRMRRFGSTAQFLDLCDRIRALAPEAGIRSNVIVGFPGETEDDVAELEEFLTSARLDAVGVFGYSDEDGTEAAGYDGKVPAEEVAARVSRIAALVDELMTQRAEDRIGTEVTVLVEQAEDDDFECTGRAAHQAPEVDGECVLERGSGLEAGDLVRCVVVGTEGADLQVSPREVLPRRAAALAGAGAS